MKQKEKRDNNTLTLLLRTLRISLPYWPFAALGSSVTMGRMYISALFSGMLMQFVVELFNGNRSMWQGMGGLYLTYVAFAVLLWTGSIVGDWSVGKIHNRLQGRLMMDWLQTQETVCNTQHSGDVFTKLTHDARQVSMLFQANYVSVLLIPIVNGVAALVTVWIVEWRLALVSLLIGAVATTITLLYSPIIRKRAKAYTDTIGTMNKSLTNIIAGAIPVRLFSLQQRMDERYYEDCNRAKDAMVAWSQKTFATMYINSNLSAVATLVFIVYGIYLASQGTLAFSAVVLVLPMQPLVNELLSGMGSAWNYLAGVMASGERIFTITDYPKEPVSTAGEPVFQTEPPIMTADGITFAYQDHRVLNNLSFTLPKGRIVALVGESGSGKSTLLRVMNRYIEPQTGSVYLQGAHSQQCPLSRWREAVVMVEQESAMFNRSIGDNIAMGMWGSGEIPQTWEVEKAAKQVYIHDFICTLPNGYATVAGEEGAALSGGQRQRIAIARAFLSKATVLLLDEPTSALDAESEILIHKALQELSATKTIVMATHRLSALRTADEIWVLRKGRIVEVGAMDELQRRGGEFARLFGGAAE